LKQASALIVGKPRFAIMGSGGVGGYFGALLARGGFDTTFIARGPHLQAMHQSGLRIEGPDEHFTVRVKSTDDPREIGPVDFVLFAVKLWDTKTAAAACRALIGRDTAVVSLQNGVSSELVLSSIVGCRHVMGGVAEISARIVEPGCLERISERKLIQFGEMHRQQSARAQSLHGALIEAGIEIELSEDINVTIWNKFVFLTGLSAMTALTGHPVGRLREDPDTRELLEQIMNEALRVAQASGVPIRDAVVAERLQFIDGLPAQIRASMAIDRAAGRQLELPWLSGAVVRKGTELGLPTPANRFVCQALKLDAMGVQH
jgi:2-dehydropantoate 2-reductase